jgi:hypothetical protein
MIHAQSDKVTSHHTVNHVDIEYLNPTSSFSSLLSLSRDPKSPEILRRYAFSGGCNKTLCLHSLISTQSPILPWIYSFTNLVANIDITLPTLSLFSLRGIAASVDRRDL